MVKLTAEPDVAEEHFGIPTDEPLEADISEEQASKLLLPMFLSMMNDRTDEELIEMGLNEWDLHQVRSWPDEQLDEDFRQEGLETIQEMFW